LFILSKFYFFENYRLLTDIQRSDILMPPGQLGFNSLNLTSSNETNFIYIMKAASLKKAAFFFFIHPQKPVTVHGTYSGRPRYCK